jgi:hypothetical protein
VTPTLRKSYAEGDDDELADVTLRDAALASLRLLDHDAQDHDLAWYAAQELPFLLELL